MKSAKKNLITQLFVIWDVTELAFIVEHLGKELNSFTYYDFNSKEKARQIAKSVAFDEAMRLQEDFNVKVHFINRTK